MTTDLIPGAEPWSHEGGPSGALCLHGFTGSPSSMRGIAEAFAAAGFSVELPRLPGHGTTVEEMMTTGWVDWTGEAEAAYQRLAARTESVVVAGLSMGGSLTLWTAAHHPEVAGIVCINPATQPQPAEVMDMVHGMIDEGTELMPGIGSDIAKPGVVEAAYLGTPLRPLVSMIAGIVELAPHYASIHCPLLLITSAQDHVVDPAQSDYLAEHYGGPVERIALERSYHVATLDYDRELIEERAVDFGRKVTTG
ncbi:MAG: alpha/beta hydrolase [Acidimicrobiia bacterium]